MKKRTQKPIDVSVDLYRLHVVVVIGWTVDAIVEHGKNAGIAPELFTEEWLRFTREATDTAQGWCSSFGAMNSDVLIWLRDRPTKASEYGTLWHELVHAVDRIANSCDPNSRFYDDSFHSEPRAFLYEYLACEITKDLWNRK